MNTAPQHLFSTCRALALAGFALLFSGCASTGPGGRLYYVVGLQSRVGESWGRVDADRQPETEAVYLVVAEAAPEP